MIRTNLLKMVAGLAMLAVSISAGNASAGLGKVLDQTGCSCCPVCDHVCKLEAEEIDEEKTCFNVESKSICIPRVVFPWQKAKKAQCKACNSCDGRGCTTCVHNGARVRKVCVLKTEKYKCPACKYTWTAEKKESRHGGPCTDSPCGGTTSCDGTLCDSASVNDQRIIFTKNTPATVITQPVAPQVAVPLVPAETISERDYDRPVSVGMSPVETTTTQPLRIRSR